MKVNKIVVLFFFIIIIFNNCSEVTSFFDYEEPKVISISPDDNEKGVDPFKTIKITFSEAVDKESAEKAFSLISIGQTTGRFSWKNDRTMLFTPIKGWTIGEKYTVVIERTLKDINRNSLQRKFVSCFYIGNNFVHPEVLASTSNPYVQQNEIIITIYFSIPMDIVSLHKAVLFTPSFNYRMQLNEAEFNGSPPYTVLRIYALENLYSMNEYTMTISTDAKSLNGLYLLREYIYNFAMYSDTVKPTIISIYTASRFNRSNLTYIRDIEAIDETANPTYNPILKNGIIEITFSELMDRKSVENAINIEPGLNSTFIWKIEQVSPDEKRDILLIAPNNGFEQDIIYKIFLESTAKDIAGNELDKKTNIYKFRIIDELPKLNKISFFAISESDGQTLDDSITSLPKYNELVDNLNIDVEDINNNKIGKFRIKLYFNKNIGGDPEIYSSNIDPITIWDNLSVIHIYGGSSSDPKKVSFKIVENTFEILLDSLEYNENFPNEYQIQIKGGSTGIKDFQTKYMIDTIKINFKIRGVI